MFKSRTSMFRSLLLVGCALLPAVLVGCKASAPSIGQFKVLTTNVSDGDNWFLNRPVQVFFNNAIDATSVNFGSVIIRPTDPANQGSPVTGTFELIADAEGNANHGIQFNPACPTNSDNSNGGFVPGNFNYELVLPTEGSNGSAVLRDVEGHQLAIGLTRSFRTPTSGDVLFADTIVGPPILTGLTVPNALGLISQDSTVISLEFNQSINPDPSNLLIDRIYVQYSNSSGLFPASGNVIAGTWQVLSNCGDGALVDFTVSGVLVPGRNIRVVLTSDFEDIGGNSNTTSQVTAPVALPTLAELYVDGPTFTEDDVTYDEFNDNFGNINNLDLGADLPQPGAEVLPGSITASFPFPGTPVGVDRNFVVTSAQGLLQVDTTGVSQITDGNGKVFTVDNGVLTVHDFTIEAGATFRAIGENPLIVYASGEAIILGTLDASGFNAQTPDGGTSRPELTVPGALGVCGGGRGGDASFNTTDYTPRGQSGFGPFGTAFGGGIGGEGGYQQDRNPAISGTLIESEYLLVGGGGGGGFTNGRTDAVFWDRWSLLENPGTFENAGPDLRIDRHTVYNALIDPDTTFVGAEAGLRGSSLGNEVPATDQTEQGPHGVHGFEDQAPDILGQTWQGEEPDETFDPAITNLVDAYDLGNPSNGPDGGGGGPSIFTDGNSGNDFYGSRFFWDGTPGVVPTLVTGELSAPHAGSGGGASGDMHTLFRLLNVEPDDFQDILGDHFPDPNFPFQYTARYFRGAGGGGGGGQVQLMTLGPITLGPAAILKVNGGSGNGGESSAEGAVNSTVSQVSGSGGGSGGHMILHSASGLNLSQIDVGTAGDPGTPATFFNAINDFHGIQAIGGRRGWAGSRFAVEYNTGGDIDALAGAEGGFDGNSTWMTGRGGAGSSGIIQIHVPNPLTDITYHATVDAAFKQYITAEDLTNPVISDRQDEVLGVYSMPVPFTLVPFYSPESQVQSDWIDTGLAELRNPANGTGPFPDFLDGTLSFDGIDPATGLVDTTGNLVSLGAVAGSDGGLGTATFQNYTVTIANPSSSFGADLLRNPSLLIGYDVLPDSTQPTPQTFEIVDAVYTASPESLVLTTRVADGPMGLIASLNWQVRTKFFGVTTTSTKDRLPASASMRIQFQGAEETSLGSNVPDVDNATDWTGDGVTTLADLQGSRYIRYRITFNIDALDSGPDLDKERPSVRYMKVPYGW